MTKLRSHPYRSVACLITVITVLAMAMPAPVLAEVVAKKGDAAMVQAGSLPSPTQAIPAAQLGQLQGEGALGAATTMLLLVTGIVLLAVLVVYAID